MFKQMFTFRNLLEIATQTLLNTPTSGGHLKQDSSEYILKTITHQGIGVSDLKYTGAVTVLVSNFNGCLL